MALLSLSAIHIQPDRDLAWTIHSQDVLDPDRSWVAFEGIEMVEVV